MSDHRENASVAFGIVDRLERGGFSPKRKSEIVALVQVMVNSELIREQAAAQVPRAPQDE